MQLQVLLQSFIQLALVGFVMLLIAMPVQAQVLSSYPNLDKQAKVFHSGWEAMQLNQLDTAYETWNKLVQETDLIPEMKRALENNLAVILIKQAKYQAAEKRLNKAIQADKQIATTIENLNQIYTYQAQQAYQRVFEKTSVTPPVGQFLFFDVVKAKSPTPGVIIDSANALTGANSVPFNAAFIFKIKQRLETWRLAWSKQNIKAYLQHYNKTEFIPAKGMSYSTWERSRYHSLQGPKFIKISLDDVQVIPLNKQFVRTQLLQRYDSNYLKNSVYKVILWRLTHGQWKIVQEVIPYE